MSERIVLVTGGAGYVGSHACKALAGAGYLPVTYDNLVRGHADAVRWGPLEMGDMLDGDRIAEVIATHRPLAVMHFAAASEVGESVADPIKYYRNNVQGTLTLLDAMRHGGVDAIVFSSTCAVYGLPQSCTLSEDHPHRPTSPYGASKSMVEQLLRDCCAAHGLRAMALRYFNAAGADADGEVGEDHDPETHLIPRAIHAALGEGPSLTIMGTDYDTPDGTCVRDYIHVTDLAAAHVAALERTIGGSGFDACNLGTGRGYSVREIVKAVERNAGIPVPAATGARRPGDPPNLVADPTRAREVLKWEPRHSGLDNIIATALAWARSDTMHRRKAARGEAAESAASG